MVVFIILQVERNGEFKTVKLLFTNSKDEVFSHWTVYFRIYSEADADSSSD